MCRFVVNVYKSPFNIRQLLDLVLQLLTNVMSFVQRSLRVHDNVNLDEIIRATLSLPVSRKPEVGFQGKLTWYARTVSIF